MKRLLLGLLFFVTLLTHGAEAQTEYHYSYVPKQLYAGQVFPVTIMATDAETTRPPEFRFDSKASAKPLEPSPLIMQNEKDRFYTFYFKAGKEDFHLPALTIVDESRTFPLPSQIISVQTLQSAPEDRFCGVIASDFRIRTSQVSTFDEKNNLVYLSIEAHEANLEDMAIPGVAEGGIEKLKRKGSLVSGEYYFVIPANVDRITFSYYNAIKQQFVPLTVSTSYRHKEVAAQVDLNPKDSGFTKLKKYALIALSLFFFVMFLIYRDRFYLLLLTLSVAALVLIFIPLKKICIREGAPLYILPVSTSTVGTTIDQRTRLPVLHRYGNYYKVEYKHGITGWIKNDDLCKN
jgi:hypothetical protein